MLPPFEKYSFKDLLKLSLRGILITLATCAIAIIVLKVAERLKTEDHENILAISFSFPAIFLGSIIFIAVGLQLIATKRTNVKTVGIVLMLLGIIALFLGSYWG